MRFAILSGLALFVGHATGLIYERAFLQYFWIAVYVAALIGYGVHRAHISTNRSQAETFDARGLSLARDREFVAHR